MFVFVGMRPVLRNAFSRAAAKVVKKNREISWYHTSIDPVAQLIHHNDVIFLSIVPYKCILLHILRSEDI